MNELIRSRLQVCSSAIAEESNFAEQFLNRYRESSYRIAIRIVSDPDMAEDIVQEALIRAFQSWDRLALVERQSAWVRKVVVRCALNALERRRVDRPLEPDHASAPASEDDFQVVLVLAKLSYEQRAILGLALGEGFSYSEIADALEIPIGTVGSRIHHAKAAFRKAWEAAK